MEGRSVGHNFERDPPKDHPCQVWFNLVQGFQRRTFKCESLRRMPSDGKSSPSELKMYKACPMIIHVQFGFNQNPSEHFFFKFTNMVLNKL